MTVTIPAVQCTFLVIFGFVFSPGKEGYETSVVYTCTYALVHIIMDTDKASNFYMSLDLHKPSQITQELKSNLLLNIKPTLLHYLEIPNTWV